MRISLSSVFFVGITVFSLSTTAAPYSIQAGEYLYEGGSGVLSIKPLVDGSYPFTLKTAGANAQVCEMEGKIKNGKAILGNNKAHPCILEFKVDPKGITVSSATSTCFEYCGLNATFKGFYRKKTSECRQDSVQSTSNKLDIGNQHSPGKKRLGLERNAANSVERDIAKPLLVAEVRERCANA